MYNLKYAVNDMKLTTVSNDDNHNYIVPPPSTKHIKANGLDLYLIDLFTFTHMENGVAFLKCSDGYKQVLEKFCELINVNDVGYVEADSFPDILGFKLDPDTPIYKHTLERIDMDDIKRRPNFRCKIIYKFEMTHGGLEANIIQLMVCDELPPRIIFLVDDEDEDEN